MVIQRDVMVVMGERNVWEGVGRLEGRKRNWLAPGEIDANGKLLEAIFLMISQQTSFDIRPTLANQV